MVLEVYNTHTTKYRLDRKSVKERHERKRREAKQGQENSGNRFWLPMSGEVSLFIHAKACKKSKVQRRGGGPERGGLEKKKSLAEGRLDSGRSLCRNNEDRGEDIK